MKNTVKGAASKTIVFCELRCEKSIVIEVIIKGRKLVKNIKCKGFFGAKKKKKKKS
jgi:hypothetical protein